MTPVTTADLMPIAREIGELRGTVHALAETVARAQQISSDEHRAVGDRLDRLQHQIDTRVAATTDVAALAARVDELESDRDRRTGGMLRLRDLGGIILGVAAVSSAISGVIMTLTG